MPFRVYHLARTFTLSTSTIFSLTTCSFLSKAASGSSARLSNSSSVGNVLAKGFCPILPALFVFPWSFSAPLLLPFSSGLLSNLPCSLFPSRSHVWRWRGSPRTCFFRRWLGFGSRSEWVEWMHVFRSIGPEPNETDPSPVLSRVVTQGWTRNGGWHRGASNRCAAKRTREGRYTARVRRERDGRMHASCEDARPRVSRGSRCLWCSRTSSSHPILSKSCFFF